MDLVKESHALASEEQEEEERHIRWKEDFRRRVQKNRRQMREALYGLLTPEQRRVYTRFHSREPCQRTEGDVVRIYYDFGKLLDPSPPEVEELCRLPPDQAELLLALMRVRPTLVWVD